MRHVHVAVAGDGAFKLWHYVGRARCPGVEVHRFPTRPPPAPPKYDARPTVRCNLFERVADYERALITWALGRGDNSVQAAADALSMKRTTLVCMIRRLGGRRRVSYEMPAPTSVVR